MKNNKEYIAYLESASVYFAERSQHLEAALIVLIIAMQKNPTVIYGDLKFTEQVKAALKFAQEKLSAKDTLNGTEEWGNTTIMEVEKFYGQLF